MARAPATGGNGPVNRPVATAPAHRPSITGVTVDAIANVRPQVAVPRTAGPGAAAPYWRNPNPRPRSPMTPTRSAAGEPGGVAEGGGEAAEQSDEDEYQPDVIGFPDRAHGGADHVALLIASR